MIFDFDPELIGQALEIMGFGMAGIFVVALILYFACLMLLKLFPNGK
ncbi:MAG: hypothetical protein K0M69_03860 [Youngiibacter sp.]|nr:hypothetical protein [Youngiibacter sp.]